MPEAFGKQRIYVRKKKPPFDTRRLAFIVLGLGLFFWLYLIAPWRTPLIQPASTFR